MTVKCQSVDITESRMKNTSVLWLLCKYTVMTVYENLLILHHKHPGWCRIREVLDRFSRGEREEERGSRGTQQSSKQQLAKVKDME